MSRNKDDEEYLKELNKLDPDGVPLDIPRDDWDFPERLNKKQLEDLIGDKNKKKKIKVAKKKGKTRLMAKEGDFVDREEFESEKEKKEASMNKKSKGGIMRKGFSDGDFVDKKVIEAFLNRLLMTEGDDAIAEGAIAEGAIAGGVAGAVSGKSLATNEKLKKKKGGMIRKGYAGGGEVVTRPQQKCRGGGAATRGLGFTIS